MRNDTIILEFVNDGDREVLLKPSVIPEIAQALTSSLIALGQIRGGMPEFTLYLAAADRGSLRIAFKAVVGLSISEDERVRLADAKTGAEVLAIVAAGLVWCGVQFGVFTPDGPSPETPSAEVAQSAETGARNVELRKSMDAFAMIAKGSGADRVIIRVPDAPSCLIADQSDISADNIGSLGDEITFPNALKVRGKLAIDPAISFRMSGTTPNYVGEVNAYSANFDLENFENPIGGGSPELGLIRVIVIWESVRPVPHIGDGKVQITGVMHHVRGHHLTPMEAVPSWARQAQAILYVKTMLVEE